MKLKLSTVTIKLKLPIAALLLGAGLTACTPQPDSNIVEDNMEFAQQQLRCAFDEIDYAVANESPESRAQREKNGWGPLTNPRNTEPDGTLHLVPSKDWTSGFFPGELWFLYEYTQNNFWKKKAQQHTDILEQEKMNGGTHDMGFKMYCSFGNGYRLTQDERYKEILLQSARTLSTRFKPKAGIIRSWDHNKDKWQCPVIIDNMMNLELLFWATKESKDSTYYNIAVSHARTTMKNHFRADYSCYHVIDYDTITGQVLKKNTHQGLAHESAWARGQAWAIYGYTVVYRETKDVRYLDFVQKVTDVYLKNLPEDYVPYWDFNDPSIPDVPRDASAACVVASALLELSGYLPAEKALEYKQAAVKMLTSLSSDKYQCGKSKPAFLLHSTGHLPAGSEIDASIIYADYYYMEALLRLKRLTENKPVIDE